MADLTKTTVYKLTLKDEHRKFKGVWLSDVIELQVNEMNELVQIGKFTYDKFYTIKPSMIKQVKRVLVQEYTEREHQFTNLDELTPQEVLSVMTDAQIIEEELSPCQTVKRLKSIVDDIVTHDEPDENNEATISVMNSVPRMDESTEKVNTRYPTQEEIIAFNRKENSLKR